MFFDTPLLGGTFVRRYKRFFADIRLDNGEPVTAHCPNSGSLKSCLVPGNPVRVSLQDRPGRKLKYTWEMIQINGGWVGINTLLPNRLVSEAIRAGNIERLADFDSLRREVKLGKNSRIDILLERGERKCFIEVKNVTLVENEIARFPDAVTERGQKHLRELMKVVKQGDDAVIFFVLQREDARIFSPADDIDPEYGKLLRRAVKSGVKLLAYQASVNPTGIFLARPVPPEL